MVDSIEGVNAPCSITLNLLAVEHPPISVARRSASGKDICFFTYQKSIADKKEQSTAHTNCNSKQQNVVAEEDSVGQVSVDEYCLQNVVQFVMGNRSRAFPSS